MMKPTIGRVVYYNNNGIYQGAAIIAYVHTDECVNLMVIDQNGNPSGRTNVMNGTWAGQWDWMPYQKVKAEAGDHNSESAEPRPEPDCEKVSR